MKVIFFGGGSFRTIPIVRAAMTGRGANAIREIQLIDRNLPRAETVGRLLRETPECRRAGCRVGWTDQAERVLSGANLVSVSMAVGSWETCVLSEQASAQHGFYGSDQLSVSGAFRSLTGGPIVLDLARKMERLCPAALLAIFANPVAVYSGMVNNHTKIRALGVCGGFLNHRWDLMRLMGRDEYSDAFDVCSAGVNHCSVLLRGTYRGEDVYRILSRRLKSGWQPPKVGQTGNARESLLLALRLMRRLYHRYGVVLFSLEGDGIAQLFPEEMLALAARHGRELTRAEVRAEARRLTAERAAWDAELRGFLNERLDDTFWSGPGSKHVRFAPADRDAIAMIVRALAGLGRQTFAASRRNDGAVRGFKDRTVLEYTVTLDRQDVRPAKDLEVPDGLHGLMSSLATHQTLVGDAVATGDPRVFAQALGAYPLQQNASALRALSRELLQVHRREIDPVFQQTRGYL